MLKNQLWFIATILTTMKITAIKQQKKRPDRYSVYIDGEYCFGLSENDLVDLGLYKGQEFTPEQLDEMRQASAVGKAYDRALNYVSIRPRSEQEIARYLQRKQYEPEIIKEAITRLKKLELVDDAVFAHKWIQWRQSTTPRSRRKLQAELRQKGIENETIENALADIDQDEQTEALKALIDKKSHRYSSRQKLMAYLSRQGFSYEDVLRALEEKEGQ